ncbi:GNAT family N-acetyltransferase [Lederbergia sp. NSJ-179]|uniref:GNAT family N-acetyltransferase n=1 Tax=Lederbergia sp. NSJ-179 TaxID=2931402 RepID=UPI001FD1428D|nr:GNAT family N-acetyltransferase [Lederbergia sp. NSJ-179]MCJ7842158.1 GNAT family N-acetyltransferase [Lederbergia sp. NSJ-179]
MIYELKKDEFYKCKSLVNENIPESVAVVSGNNPGRIFVDNKDYPTTGLIWFKSMDIGFNFIGDCFNTNFNQEIGPFVDKYIKSEAKKIGMDWFEASGGDPDWDRTIHDIFKHKNVETQEQHVYILRERNGITLPAIELPPGYQLVKVSGPLLRSNEIENCSFLHDKILSFWDSIQDFLDKGIGYCIIYHNKIVSFCFSGFITNAFSVTDVETLEEYRRKNLAQIVAVAYLQDCMSRGLIPYWDCMKENLPSNAVAKKVGFEKARNYYVQYFQF